ncbi:hypothetical protein MTR67_052003 [Solanum verrucosum]|uniref:Uncharacterized protein n=1 Tax=Solanum verrucosum TaxID=315347 RepID=A0AAF0V8H6_SOLVR|nr:hypothetical protein MTR67_052003 [Solanum verrucosum]
MQQNEKLQQELELLRWEHNNSRGGIPSIDVLTIAFLKILLVYILKTYICSPNTDSMCIYCPPPRTPTYHQKPLCFLFIITNK